MAPTPPVKFTLRFRNHKTHEMLGRIAEHHGVSKNRLAEEMLQRELQAAALLLEFDLTGTLKLVQDYTQTAHWAQDIRDSAEAEAYAEDPLKARMVEPPR